MSHPVPACHHADRLAGLQGLFDKADLLVVTPSPPTLGAQHIDLHSRRDLKARRNSNELDKRVRETQPLIIILNISFTILFGEEEKSPHDHLYLCVNSNLYSEGSRVSAVKKGRLKNIPKP
ncbi:hypothetical protein [Bradyrhizobium sp. SBR1B]|uniref:hypothetical protein n=1 Tax=Bradyrhizobium sp. SBR1B TaxID=2663836 RepID=UPI00181AA31C|nr:hypothetical protein [Bradyrhizobium sp. SBR1B]